MSDAEINNLYEILRKLPKGVNYSTFLKLVSNEMKMENIGEIAKATYSLISLMLNKSLTIEEIVVDLIEAYIYQSEEKDVLSLDKQLLEERIKFVLLNGDSIKLTFQAVELLNNSSKRVLRHSEIASEVTLIFEEDLKSKNALFIHNLKIEYDLNAEGGSSQYLLDKKDLQQLKSQIEEALIREENIKVNNQGVINFLDVSE